MRLRPLSRRTFLRGLGTAAVGLPLLEAMGTAQAVTPPKRVVFVFTGNGFPMERWRCTVDADDSTVFPLSEILAPLEPIREHCLFLEGLPMNSSYDPAQHASAHQGGCASMFTGTWAGPGDQDGGENLLAGYPISESIDNALATAIGGETRFPAYYFGVMNTFPALLTRAFYAGQDVPISANADPYAINTQLFGDIGADQGALDRRAAQRQAVLGGVLGDYRALRCRVSTADRQRLELHMTQMEEIQRTLDLGAGLSPVCVQPDLGAPIATQDFANIPAIGQIQMDQLVMALTCDLTRVAALQWVSPVVIYDWLGQSEAHHDISHQNTTEAKDKLSVINAWYAEQFRTLVEKLASVPEGDGTLLDSTVVVWASECGDPWTHDRRDVAWTLAGRCGGYFRPGRYLRLPGGDAYSHNRLLLSLFDAMGAPRDVFGGDVYCEGGPLAEVR